MKNSFLASLLISMSLFISPVFSQTEVDTTSLGLPGDNLDLYAVLNLFQKSKTIEDFEKTLNDEKTAINNLDLNLDDKVDFIKVVTKQDDNDFTFILQVDVSEEEVQDIAVILISKDKDAKVTMQIVGDKDLYGKDYVIAPTTTAPAVTANPGYVGANPVTESVPATETVVVVESAPIVQYVYSPVYVPYYPPYYYAYYPPYYRPFAVVSVSIYRHNHYHHHHGYHGGRGNTVVIHNTNNYNNYNRNRNSSNTVNRNNTNGNYNRNNGSTRPSNGSSASAKRPSTNQSKASTNRPSTNQSKASSAQRPTTSQSKASTSRPSTSQSKASSSRSSSMGSSRSSSGGGSRGGGGRRR